MNEVTHPETGCDRMQKHIELDEAIKSIYQIKHKANDLLKKISNEIVPESGGEPSPNKSEIPSLEQVLNEGSDRIKITCEEVHGILEQINTKLF